MKNRIGIAVVLSVSLHAVAMTVSLPRTPSLNFQNVNTGDSQAISIQLSDAAPPLPTAASPMIGQGVDATAKLEGAALETKTATISDDVANAISTRDPQVGDAAAQRTKANESSATSAQTNVPQLKSVLLTPISFDQDLYPVGGGKLKIRVDIDESGMPTAVTKISQYPKSFDAQPFLDTVLLARFLPAEKDGKLVANSVVVELGLSLEQETFKFRSAAKR